MRENSGEGDREEELWSIDATYYILLPPPKSLPILSSPRGRHVYSSGISLTREGRWEGQNWSVLVSRGRAPRRDDREAQKYCYPGWVFGEGIRHLVRKPNDDLSDVLQEKWDWIKELDKHSATWKHKVK